MNIKSILAIFALVSVSYPSLGHGAYPDETKVLTYICEKNATTDQKHQITADGMYESSESDLVYTYLMILCPFQIILLSYFFRTRKLQATYSWGCVKLTAEATVKSAEFLCVLAFIGWSFTLLWNNIPCIGIYRNESHMICKKNLYPKFQPISDLFNILETDPTEINFQDCELSQFHENSFKYFYNIRTLNVSHFAMKSLPSNIMLNNEQMTTLIASNNKITEINVTAFPHENQIEKLDVSHNQLSKIWSHSFQNCKLLIDLDLSFNAIDYIDNDAFVANKQLFDVKLEFLDLSHNKIMNISNRIFNQLTQLRHLQLSHNQIKEIAFFSFQNNKKLKIIDLSFNNLTEISNYVFGGVFSLEKIILSHNQLTRLTPELFQQFKNLVFVDLSGNFLNEINSYMFEGLTRVLSLNLSGNNITEIQSGTFASLKSLETLDLSSNPLKMLNIDCLPSHSIQLRIN